MIRQVSVLLMVLALAGCGGDSVERHRADGKKAYAEGDFTEARHHFVAGLARNPSDRELLYFAGMAYQQDLMYDSALYYLKRADLLNPQDREINLQIYKVAVALEDYPNAISAIETLARTGDGYDRYYEQLADLFEKDNKPGQSYYWARKATVRGTDVPEMYLIAASRAADYDSMAVALELLDTAMVKWPEDHRFPGTKALILFFQGKLQQAEAILRPLADSGKPVIESVHLTLARVLAAQDSRSKKQEALRIYERLQPTLPATSGIDSLIQQVKKELGQ